MDGLTWLSPLWGVTVVLFVVGVPLGLGVQYLRNRGRIAGAAREWALDTALGELSALGYAFIFISQLDVGNGWKVAAWFVGSSCFLLGLILSVHARRERRDRRLTHFNDPTL